MGSGSWTTNCATSYYTSRGYTAVSLEALNSDSVQEFYTERHLSEVLNPKNVIRQCCNSDEHPNTIPVILALDVTGSMGSLCAQVAKKLDTIMTSLYDKYKDIEFCIMGIGDLAYDSAPIQMSQYESDVRILESLDKVYMEHGGGGNAFESYSAAWYMGLHHTKLDCWEQGRKGIIITMGDEPLNPYLPTEALSTVTGDSIQDPSELDTQNLYNAAKEKFNIYHIGITDSNTFHQYEDRIHDSFSSIIGERYMTSSNENLPEVIERIIKDSTENTAVCKEIDKSDKSDTQEISW